MVIEMLDQATAWKEIYLNYLQSETWRLRRIRSLELAKYHCAICWSHTNLDVHHNTYAHLGAESDDELIVLCHPCHKLFHNSLYPLCGAYKLTENDAKFMKEFYKSI